MSEHQDMINKIQELRKHLNELVDKKTNLQDAEIISASRLLDTILNEYEKIIKYKK
jgi:stage 0 sporulation regulatory protein